MYNFYPVVVPTTEFSCGNNEYQCNNASKCINKTKICDKNSDCPDGDDEVSCCKYLHLCILLRTYFNCGVIML